MTQSITKSTVKIPPLENGDRLNRLEFETRYQQMTHVKKAELIEGIVYLGSPVKINKHGAPHANIIGWFGVYSAYTNGVQIGDNCNDNEIDWFRLKEQKYIKLQADENGIIKSEIYPGLWLDITALLNGELVKVLDILKQGIDTYDHQKFCQRISIND